MAIYVLTNPFGNLHVAYLTALMLISASYSVGTHHRKALHNPEFNRFEPKQYHHQTHNIGYSSFAIDKRHGIPAYDKLGRLNSNSIKYPSLNPGIFSFMMNDSLRLPINFCLCIN